MDRRLYTAEEFLLAGGTERQLRTSIKNKTRVRVCHGVYADGAGDPTPFELALGPMLRANDSIWGIVAAVIQRFDGVEVPAVDADGDGDGKRPYPRYKNVPVDPRLVLVDGYRCTCELQTLIDIAPLVNDLVWEQALESVLRRGAVTVDHLEALLPGLSRSRVHGVGRMRRVLDVRPNGAPPTESLLETLFVQLARTLPGLAPPVRQFRVLDQNGQFVARVDLCWPELGLFIELDGRFHNGQLVHDFNRQTAVIAATGWLVGRFTWAEVRRAPRWSARRLATLVDQARSRTRADV